MEIEGSSKQSEENLVKKTCKELGITQKELAERIGISPRTLSDWSSERVTIPKIGQKILKMLPIEKEYSELKESLKVALQDKLDR